MNTPELNVIVSGGITSAKGFSASGVHAGFRRNPARLDMALVVADEPCPCAGTFTQNPFASAPVRITRSKVRSGALVKAVVVNSGNANAATGAAGRKTALDTCDLAARALGCDAENVLVSSTGVVGQQLSMKPFEVGLPQAIERLSWDDGGAFAASAILTTDTFPKEYAVTYASAAPGLEGREFAIGGCIKGSGMIMPNMATMICIITTDAPLDHETAQAALSSVVGETFNKLTIDADTSPNDTCLLLCSGAAAPGARIERGTPAFDEFAFALHDVCRYLARMVARDGEGSTKIITVNVTGAASDSDADAAARKVANSTLVKTAIFGHDCNWGRIAVAAGSSGARFSQENVSIDIMGIPVCRHGMALDFDEDEALRRFEQDEIVIDCDLGEGDRSTTIWTCDLTYDYVRINGDYRT
ncbi:MAG: bifunctional glutamate N-acetyltransferase/amino-acid acetyltransferase ArgJ [Atopobiaceae bacterium]|jgi:glutamate N-acetyltransferase/amino-acid N-acetyltransferase|nr:bifunctional glutamate N-acetyltransferase/amino-acid acetyltransferase ArgJ [Atopobiaceae bacterium]